MDLLALFPGGHVKVSKNDARSEPTWSPNCSSLVYERYVCTSDLRAQELMVNKYFRVAGWQLKKIGIWAADLDLAQPVMNRGRVARAASSSRYRQ
jgi:hypothetical protein